ncbi:hypothetical protein ACLOJK_004915 [Asimina triloba]
MVEVDEGDMIDVVDALPLRVMFSESMLAWSNNSAIEPKAPTVESLVAETVKAKSDEKTLKVSKTIGARDKSIADKQKVSGRRTKVSEGKIREDNRPVKERLM